MAYARNERLKFGTWTATALLSDDSALLRSFPHATYPHAWVMAYDRVATPYAVRSTAMDGVEQGFGGITFKAVLGNLNDAMLGYLMAQFPAGVLSAPVTVCLYDRLPPAGWKVINCMMSLPELTQEGLGAVHDTYFHRAEFAFANGVIAQEE